MSKAKRSGLQPLHLISETTSPPPRRPPTFKDESAHLGVLGQYREIIKPKNRQAAFIGAILGGFVPIASFGAIHYEYDPTTQVWMQPAMWVVAACLGFSLPKVYGWGKVAFNSWFSGICFALLTEAIMVAFHTPWLSIPSLVILVCINGVSAGANVALGKGKSAP